MINILFNQFHINASWCFDTIRKYIHPDEKVTVIPFSFQEQFIYSERSWQSAYGKEQGHYYSQIVESFLPYGIDENSINWVNYFSDTKKEAKQKIEEADILYFPGGLPDKMMERIIEFDLMGMIQRHSGIVMGFSAGAMIQMAEYHITPDEDYESFGYFKGLRLIHSFDIEVHFNATRLQLDCINRSIRETGHPVYAMEDEGALIVADGKVVTIGKVHYFNERRDHMFEIIKATLNHSDDLGYVHTISWQQAYQGIIPQMFLDQLTPEARAAFFKKAIPISKHEFYIAYLNGKPVGMMSIGKSRDKDLDDHAAEVSSIYCISDVWGKGYGRQFMDYAIDRLKDQSFRSVTLWVFEENQRARTFYEKYGYSFDGTKEQSDIGGKLLTEMRYVYTIV